MKHLIFILYIVFGSFAALAQMTDAKIIHLFEIVDKIDKAESYHKDFSSDIDAVKPENSALVRDKIDQLIEKSKKESLTIIRKRFTEKELVMVEKELQDTTLFAFSEKTVSFIRYWQSFRRDFFDELKILINSNK